ALAAPRPCGILGPFGAWRSLVARTVRVGEVPGSNPGAPIWRHLDAARCVVAEGDVRCTIPLRTPGERRPAARQIGAPLAPDGWCFGLSPRWLSVPTVGDSWRGAGEDVEECLDDLGVELGAGVLLEFLAGLGGCERGAVRAVRGHGVVGVAGEGDAAGDRDVAPSEVVGVAGAVVAFVLGADGGSEMGEALDACDDSL